MITQTIGRKLRQYRQKQGYSQEALADRAGLHPTYIGQVERGEKNITVETLGKITESFLPIDRLSYIVSRNSYSCTFSLISLLYH